MGAATKKVLGSPACHVAETFTAHQIHGRPGQELLSTLGVLRRPATAADRLAADESSATGPGSPSTRSDATDRPDRGERVLHRAHPAGPAGGVPSARCFALQKSALAQALPKAPAALRSADASAPAAFIAYDSGLAAKPPVDGDLRGDGASDNGSGMACGETPTEIRHGGSSPPMTTAGSAAVVPDGVASVTLSFPAAGGQRARSLTTTVHNNFYAVEAGAHCAVQGRLTHRHLARGGRAGPAQLLSARAGRVRNGVPAAPEACLAASSSRGGHAEVSASSSSSSASATATTQKSSPSTRPKTSGG